MEDGQHLLLVDHTIGSLSYAFHRDPLFTDVVIQSNGIGFVANDLSTLSVLARRRVETWHRGITKTVRWGNPHSDDH
jgi:hypothetical protein